MNSSDYVPNRVYRHFHDGVPLYDFVVIIYRGITPGGRKSKYYHAFSYRYDHEAHPNRIDRINECLHKSMKKRKPKLRKGYRWGKPQVMRVD